MDSIVESLNAAYNDYVAALATVLESLADSATPGQRTAALEIFKQRWELFRVSCDQAEEFVESLKQRIGSECLVDEATGSSASVTGGGAKPGLTGLPPISAVRLEQMSKAVRWLVLELQGSGAAAAASAGGGGVAGSGTAHGHGPGSFDARFSEDSAQ